MIDIDLQLATAYGPVEALPTIKKTAFLGDIETDCGRVTAILKLLKIEDITREAVCWALARSLSLPTPPAYLVQVDPSVVTGRHSGNPLHLAFGSIEVGRGFRYLNEEERNALRKWPHAIACAVFDLWIHCTDRYPNNLLMDVNGDFWLIDHEEALPLYARFDTHSVSTLIPMLRDDCSEFELHSLKHQAIEFAKNCREVDLAELHRQAFRNCPLEIFGESIAKHFEFLRNRVAVLPRLINESVVVARKQITLDNDIREEMERYD